MYDNIEILIFVFSVVIIFCICMLKLDSIMDPTKELVLYYVNF